MNKNMTLLAVIAVLVLAGSGAWVVWSSLNTSGTLEPLSVGILPFETSALLYIAEDQGYFASNGLNVTLREYNSAPMIIEDMEKGTLDVAQSSEYPIVVEAYNNENISVIGCIDKFQSAYLAGRKDRGIENISDLKGKKIGVPCGTTTEFYLGRFLNRHGIAVQDVTIVDIPWDRTVGELANGSVDAIMIRRQSDITPVKERFGGDVVLWPAQSDQPAYLVMSCKNDWIASHPETIERLLQSLAQAEHYALDHPDEAKAIVQHRTNLSKDSLDDIWPQHQFMLTLERSLLIAMNDEALWMIENNLTPEKTPPDLRAYISTQCLLAVKPDAVNIR